MPDNNPIITDEAARIFDDANVASPDGTAAPVVVAKDSGKSGLLGDLLSRYALIGVWAVMAIFFAVKMPSTFLTHGSFSSIFGSQQVLVFLAMSVMVTLVVGEFDLSVASVMGISATLVPVLAGLHHWNIWLAVLAGLAAAALAGVVNAFFVVVLDVSSFVVTLGMGTLLMGISQWASNQTIVSVNNPSLSKLSIYQIFGMPVSFYYGIGLALLIAYILAYTPLGRSMVFVGANREVARLAGIRVQRIRFGAYIAGSLLSGLAGVILVATLGGADSSTTTAYLLPALAAVFLGTAVVQPGSFNPLGTMVAIYFLQTGIFGLQLLGAKGWITNVFYGAGLVLAVAVAKIVRDKSKKA